MAEPEPRHVVTFRAGTAETVIVAFLVVLGAVFAVGFAWVARGICEDSECRSEGLVAVIVAVAGLVPALAMLVDSGRTRGHPWIWFLVTALVYGFWALILTEWISG